MLFVTPPRSGGGWCRDPVLAVAKKTGKLKIALTRSHLPLVVFCCSLLGVAPLQEGCASWFSPMQTAGIGKSQDTASTDNRRIHHDKAGDYFSVYPVPLETTTAAAKVALQRIGMDYDAVTSRSSGHVVIQGMTGSQDTVAPTATRVSIHFDYYGRRSLSLRFQHDLAQELKVDPIAEASH